MDIVVLKFGGTSVCDEKTRYEAFKHIRREVNAGYRVVVVVSAMGRVGAPTRQIRKITLLLITK